MLTTMESDAELSKIAFSKKDAHFRPIHSPIVSIMERDKIEETKLGCQIYAKVGTDKSKQVAHF